jgi:polyisoprenyl-teichoic acid--peptidoglycan teichoic acid transferase
MTSTRKLLAFPALGLAAALVWTVAGGMTVATGQEKEISIHRAHEGSFRKPYGSPIFILALGSDAGAPKYGRGGTYGSGRADSIHIIAINPAQKKATLVGIPRDSYVDLACGGKDKINAGLQAGGPKCMVDTVDYALGGFQSVENAVNDLGGIPVKVARGTFGNSKRVLKDDNSRAKGIRTGANVLNGHDALAYARDRHDYIDGDFDRTVHQGEVFIGGLTKARTIVTVDPGKTLSFLRTIFKNVRTDVPVVEAFHLGLLCLQIKPEDVTNTLLDGHADNVGKASVVFLDNPLPLLANVADDALID